MWILYRRSLLIGGECFLVFMWNYMETKSAGRTELNINFCFSQVMIAYFPKHRSSSTTLEIIVFLLCCLETSSMYISTFWRCCGELRSAASHTECNLEIGWLSKVNQSFNYEGGVIVLTWARRNRSEYLFYDTISSWVLHHFHSEPSCTSVSFFVFLNSIHWFIECSQDRSISFNVLPSFASRAWVPSFKNYYRFTELLQQMHFTVVCANRTSLKRRKSH